MKVKKRVSLSNAFVEQNINANCERTLNEINFSKYSLNYMKDLQETKYGISAAKYQRQEQIFQEENNIAYFADQWKKTGKFPSFLDRGLAVKIYQTISDEKMMRDKSNPAYAVPEKLQGIVRRTLAGRNEKQEKNKQTIPALIVELSRNSLEVIKSTWEGFSRISLPVASVRSYTASDSESFSLNQKATTPSYHRIFLSQNIERDKSLEYQVMRDHENSLTLLVRLPYGYRNTSAVLYQGKGKKTRIIDSCCLNPEDMSLSFSKIKIGEYVLAFSGDISFSMNVLIRPKCLPVASDA